MSGTSLDGADAVVADLSGDLPRVLGWKSAPFSPSLRAELFALNTAGPDEAHRMALAANQLADHYAEVALLAIADAGMPRGDIAAIGCHGQTIRHRPELGYTLQINNPARLAEKTGCNVVSDFRSRDIAAGGQGAPLVPAFHDRAFRSESETRVVVNVGGIANLTVLEPGKPIRGFDSGPGNCLLDEWIGAHRGLAFDEDGAWARQGTPDLALLEELKRDSYFGLPPPKSTGRDRFNLAWLAPFRFTGAVEDMQATLLELTAWSIADHVARFAPGAARLVLCGGGSRNNALIDALSSRLSCLAVETTATYGIDPQQVEALAFAWLASRAIAGQPVDYSTVTGAAGPRIMGSITRA